MRILLFILYTLWAGNAASQTANQDRWIQKEIKCFADLTSNNAILLHPSFLLNSSQIKAEIAAPDFYTDFKISYHKGDTLLICKLAEDNILSLKITIQGPTVAILSHLTCHCNLGIERSIFNHNSNPSPEMVGTLTIQDGKVHATYTDHFKNEFLALSPFAAEFFKREFYLYQRP